MCLRRISLQRVIAHEQTTHAGSETVYVGFVPLSDVLSAATFSAKGLLFVFRIVALGIDAVICEPQNIGVLATNLIAFGRFSGIF